MRVRRPDRVGDRESPCAEHLGDVERIAAGFSVELVGIHAKGLGKLRDCFGGQRLEPETLHDAVRGELTQYDAQRVPRVQFILA